MATRRRRPVRSTVGGARLGETGKARGAEGVLENSVLVLGVRVKVLAEGTGEEGRVLGHNLDQEGNGQASAGKETVEQAQSTHGDFTAKRIEVQLVVIDAINVYVAGGRDEPEESEAERRFATSRAA